VAEGLGPVIERDGPRIRVGTCSWTDRTLVQEADWYPKRSMSAAERLAYYAARYPIAEADSTYYFPPTAELCRSWVERTPRGFVMNVKAYSLFTGHPTKPSSLWRDLQEALPREVSTKRNLYQHHLPPDAFDEAWKRFRAALRPLQRARKLGAVLFQYPHWFTPKRANRDELAQLRQRMGRLPVCVEFRAPAWLAADDRDRTLGVLRDHDLALVIVDAPKASKLPRVMATTTDLAVVRFHGRADDTWNQQTGTAAERFRYLYSKRQLRAWAPRLEQLAEKVKDVHALMNNCYRDFGVQNAAELQAMLAAT
jgi:uncharacterized protein YecE (DUF72 family)